MQSSLCFFVLLLIHRHIELQGDIITRGRGAAELWYTLNKNTLKTLIKLAELKKNDP